MHQQGDEDMKSDVDSHIEELWPYKQLVLTDPAQQPLPTDEKSLELHRETCFHIKVLCGMRAKGPYFK
eukprot:1047639-Pyramimonas_sp.AAC.1